MNIMRTKFTFKVKNDNSNNTFVSTLAGEEKNFHPGGRNGFSLFNAYP